MTLLGQSVLTSASGKSALESAPHNYEPERATSLQLVKVPAVEELHTSAESRPGWINYSAFDAKATHQLYQCLSQQLCDTPCSVDPAIGSALGLADSYTMMDFYEDNWRPFGELLTDMEKLGMLVNRCGHRTSLSRLQQRGNVHRACTASLPIVLTEQPYHLSMPKEKKVPGDAAANKHLCAAHATSPAWHPRFKGITPGCISSPAQTALRLHMLCSRVPAITTRISCVIFASKQREDERN